MQGLPRPSKHRRTYRKPALFAALSALRVQRRNTAPGIDSRKNSVGFYAAAWVIIMRKKPHRWIAANTDRYNVENFWKMCYSNAGGTYRKKYADSRGSAGQNEICKGGKGVSDDIAKTVALLFDKNNAAAYKALQKLQKESEKTDCVYPYMDRFGDMLDSDNSYVRTRGLVLIAYNAKWDTAYKIDELLDRYLKHITDVKPITARQCIKLLPLLAQYKPELKADLLRALHQADISVYDGSMQPLVYKDIQKALQEIQKA